jgi:hypothetical protein
MSEWLIILTFAMGAGLVGSAVGIGKAVEKLAGELSRVRGELEHIRKTLESRSEEGKV